MKEAFAEMNADWKKGEDEMKAKMDSIIELQNMHLNLERERLQFEREKFGLVLFREVYQSHSSACSSLYFHHHKLCAFQL